MENGTIINRGRFRKLGFKVAELVAAMLRSIRRGRAATSLPEVFSWLFRAGRFLPTGVWNRIFTR